MITFGGSLDFHIFRHIGNLGWLPFWIMSLHFFLLNLPGPGNLINLSSSFVRVKFSSTVTSSSKSLSSLPNSGLVHRDLWPNDPFPYFMDLVYITVFNSGYSVKTRHFMLQQ